MCDDFFGDVLHLAKWLLVEHKGFLNLVNMRAKRIYKTIKRNTCTEQTPPAR